MKKQKSGTRLSVSYRRRAVIISCDRREGKTGTLTRKESEKDCYPSPKESWTNVIFEEGGELSPVFKRKLGIKKKFRKNLPDFLFSEKSKGHRRKMFPKEKGPHGVCVLWIGGKGWDVP